MFVFQKDISIKQLCCSSVLLYETALGGYSHNFFSNSLSTAVIWRKTLYWNFRKISILHQTRVMLYGPMYVVELPCFRSISNKMTCPLHKVTHASPWFDLLSCATLQSFYSDLTAGVRDMRHVAHRLHEERKSPYIRGCLFWPTACLVAWVYSLKYHLLCWKVDRKEVQSVAVISPVHSEICRWLSQVTTEVKAQTRLSHAFRCHQTLR